MNQVIYSNKEKEPQVHQEGNSQIERARIHSSIQLKMGEKTIEEMQKRFVENLIDIRLRKVMAKFDDLEKRVISL